jgi:hypothetical protein
MVPGLCHMTPSAARVWVARARRDGRALDRELAYQESAARDGRLDASAAPVGHDHSSGHHGHGKAHHHSHAEDKHVEDKTVPAGTHPGPAAND